MTLFEQMMQEQIDQAKEKFERTQTEKKEQELQNLWTEGVEESQQPLPKAS